MNKKSFIGREIILLFLSLFFITEAHSQLSCTKYNISPTLTLTATPSTPVYGQPTTLQAVFTYNGIAASSNYLTVYPKGIIWTGGSYTTISSTNNSKKISVNPSVTTTYTAKIIYDLVREPDLSTVERVDDCFITKTITVTTPIITVTSGAKTLACGATTSQTYTSSGFPGASTYSWTWPAGWTGPATTSTTSATATPNGSSGGDVKVTVTVNGLSQTSAPYAVSVSSPPSISISGPSFICDNGTFATTVPNGYTLSWSSSNPSALTINSSGAATRQNNFNGQVPITATLSGACGSTKTHVVNVGNYFPTGTSSVNSNCSGNSFNVLNTSLSAACTANSSVYFAYKITDPNYSNFVFTPVSVPSGASWSSSGGNLYMTVTAPSSQGTRAATIAVSATGPCGPYTVNFTSTAVNYSSGGYSYSYSPNPASETLTIQQTSDSAKNSQDGSSLKEGPSATHYFRLYDFKNNEVVLEGPLSGRTELDVSTLYKGRYILKIQLGDDKEETHQVLIK